MHAATQKINWWWPSLWLL